MGIIKASKLIYDYIRRDEDDHVEEVKRAIDDLTLDIKQGDFVAILAQRFRKVHLCQTDKWHSASYRWNSLDFRYEYCG